MKRIQKKTMWKSVVDEVVEKRDNTDTSYDSSQKTSLNQCDEI